MGMAAEYPKHLILLSKLAGAVQRGGSTAAERRALSERFGVSEDVLLRYERAKVIFDAEIFNDLRHKALVVAMRRPEQLGKDPSDPDDNNELVKAYYRLEAAMSDNPIVHEMRDARAALLAALGVSTSEE